MTGDSVAAMIDHPVVVSGSQGVIGCSVAHGANPSGEGGVAAMAEVRIQEGESIESALRRFKRKVQQEDIIKDIKETLLLSEARRQATREVSAGPKAVAQEAAPRRRVTPVCTPFRTPARPAGSGIFPAALVNSRGPP